MPWKSPGNDNQQDPWSNKPGRQGPPDLDEVFRKLSKRLGGLFGRGGGGSGSVGYSPFFGIALIAVIAGLLYSMFYTVDQGYRTVVLRFGEYVRTSTPGLNIKWPFPIESVYPINISAVRDATHEAPMLTQDENIVKVKFTAQYRIKDVEDYIFKVRSPDETLHQAMESAIREAVGASKIDGVLKDERVEISAKTMQRMQAVLDQYATGIEVTTVNLQQSQPPDPVQNAFFDVVKSREDQQRFISEAEAYANSIVPLARGEAARLIQEAEAYRDKVIANSEGEAERFLKLLREYQKSPAVTRQRLYLQAVESVLSNSSKVIVDLKQGNNIIYLPLDKMVQPSNQSTSDTRFGTVIRGNEPSFYEGVTETAPSQSPRDDRQPR